MKLRTLFIAYSYNKMIKKLFKNNQACLKKSFNVNLLINLDWYLNNSKLFKIYNKKIFY